MPDRKDNNSQDFTVCVIKSDLTQIRIPKQAILDELQRCSFCEQTIFAIKLAVEEALANAVKHGNKSDGSKTITVRYHITPDVAEIIVRDEGEGFCPDDVPDCTEPQRLSLPSGRGLMLIKAYMDEVRYLDHGREVYFSKKRKPCNG